MTIEVRRPSVLVPRYEAAANNLTGHVRELGRRLVLVDHVNNPQGNQYAMLREFPHPEAPTRLVDEHYHACDSYMTFLGKEQNFTGLDLEVLIDGVEHRLRSPITVYVPAYITHTFRLVSGPGMYLNELQAPHGDYNAVTFPRLFEGARSRRTSRKPYRMAKLFHKPQTIL